MAKLLQRKTALNIITSTAACVNCNHIDSSKLATDIDYSYSPTFAPTGGVCITKEGGREGREGGTEGGREREGGRQGGREVGREGGRDGGR